MDTHTAHSRKGVFANKRNMFIVLGVLLLITVIVWNVLTVQEKKQKEEYAQKMESLLTEMIDSGAKAETVGNHYATAWSAAIKGTYKLDGKFYGDFNDAIEAVRVYNKSNIWIVQADESKVDKGMKELQNPPEEFENAYDEMTELYKVYKKYVSLCTEPKGSLITYNQQRNELSSDFISLKESVESKIRDLE